MATKKQVLNVETKVNEIDGMTLVLIPSGEFMMGAPDNDSLAARNEKPQVKVTLTNSYWITTTPVTQQSIQKILGQEFIRTTFKGEKYPATDLTLSEVFSYCEKVGGRLPTEAEWEWAARAGSEEVRPIKPKDFCWYNKNSKGELNEVGLKKPNAWGLYDMMGNIGEFTLSPWQFELLGGTDPGHGNSDVAIDRVIKSGSFENSENCMSATHRGMTPSQNKVVDVDKPWTIQNTLGFRYVIST